jgi:hypothetical protein
MHGTQIVRSKTGFFAHDVANGERWKNAETKQYKEK